MTNFCVSWRLGPIIQVTLKVTFKRTNTVCEANNAAIFVLISLNLTRHFLTRVFRHNHNTDWSSVPTLNFHFDTKPFRAPKTSSASLSCLSRVSMKWAVDEPSVAKDSQTLRASSMIALRLITSFERFINSTGASRVSCMILKRVFAHAVPVAKTVMTVAVSERGSAICYSWLETELLEFETYSMCGCKKNFCG